MDLVWQTIKADALILVKRSSAVRSQYLEIILIVDENSERSELWEVDAATTYSNMTLSE
jgi:hypothetical protein